ncbi:MAG: hypothetical protein ABII01_07155 [Candidatus Woesearchaeota archaeon]
MNNKRKKKAQVAVSDLFIAIFVFMILITIILVSWRIYSLRLNNNVAYRDMTERVYYISDILVKSQGFPEDWEDNPLYQENPDILGLADSPRNISIDKVAWMESIDGDDRDKIKDLLKIRGYLYSIVISDFESDTHLVEFGDTPAEIGQIIRIKRIVNYDDERAWFIMSLWIE